MEQTAKKQGRLLTIKDLSVKYVTKDETVSAVNGVSLELNYGDALGLVGETGAGKTTIAKSILRILPNPPAVIDGGSIELDGQNLLTLPEEEMRKIRGKRAAMIFQDPMTALNPVRRVGEQIAEGIRIHEKVSRRQANEMAVEMLEMVGISADRFREFPHQFSGGMKQRVVIAIALACNPDLLIADEPTSALDVTIQAQVLDTIGELKEKKNTAMILITHDFGIVAKSCNKVGVVYAGEIIEFGTTRQVFEHPMHPYTKGLFEAIPKMSLDVDRLSPISGAMPDPTHLPEGCCFRSRCPYAREECRTTHPQDTTLDDGHRCKCIRCLEIAGSKEGNHAAAD
ncbi:MAG: ABC transporter ATP-binding protein [Clostridia bacterium]|nr:ABC transporter ATP-binding protein [Clostridia bacterium]